MIRMKAASICWCIAFPAYLLTAGQVSAHELVTGAVVAIGAALFADLLAATSPLRFNLPGGSLRPMLKALADIPRASALTAVALWRVMVTGRSGANTKAAAFDHGARDNPSERTRRAIALLLATLTPDRFVIRMEADGTVLHRIVRSNHAVDTRWLA